MVFYSSINPESNPFGETLIVDGFPSVTDVWINHYLSQL